jgi:hypothetical protein
MFEGIVISIMAGSFLWLNVDFNRDLSHQEVTLKSGETVCVVKNNMTHAKALKDGNLITINLKDIKKTGEVCFFGDL